MQRIRNNKKGSAQDLLFIGIFILFSAFVVLIGFTIISSFNDQVQTGGMVTDADAQTASQSLTDYFPGVIDNSFLLLVVGLAVAALVLAAMVRVHPIFIVFFIITLFFLIFFSGIFSNIYQTMAADPTLSVYADQLTFISLILEYLPFFVGIFGTVLMIVIYKLGGAEEQ